MPVRPVPEELLPHLRRARDFADRHYAQPLDLTGLAAAAGVSKYYFLRCFAATYGRTPAAYLAERRIERAQDLLRATNITVTEACMLVGYSSLGSFSRKFTELVGVSPSAYQAKFADGAPRIPGCYVFMHGLSDRRPVPGSALADDAAGNTVPGASAGDNTAISEKPGGRDRA
uniref:helix-turn-helix transcriptional regulator n=1 Tax=Nocardia donostiensis TaxID=1538463 RepID=UPI0009DA0848|nr:AraC family transcriptional regulator [Nocardia donostiensis]